MNDIDDSEMSFIDNPDSKTLNNIIKPSVEIPSIQQIVLALISDKDNIELKTEIYNPLAMTLIEMFGKTFKQKGYLKTDLFIESLIFIYRLNMVSNKRKSRIEVEHILSSWMEKIKTDDQLKLMVKTD